MEIVQSPLFKRAYKKLHGQELKTTNMAIKSIMANPEIGNEKKPVTLKLIMLGVHENFYRDLKNYLY